MPARCRPCPSSMPVTEPTNTPRRRCSTSTQSIRLKAHWKTCLGVTLILVSVVVLLVSTGVFRTPVALDQATLKDFTIVAGPGNQEQALAIYTYIAQETGVLLPVTENTDFAKDHAIYVGTRDFNSYGGYRYRISTQTNGKLAAIYIDGSGEALIGGAKALVEQSQKNKNNAFPFGIEQEQIGYEWNTTDTTMTGLGFQLNKIETTELAEGVYDVTLSKASEHTLFADDFAKESFMQKVDNINTIYVAMTRAGLGMHLIAKTPSNKCLKSLEEGDLTQFTDFSQILYWFVSSSCFNGEVPGNDELVPPFSVLRSVDDLGTERFDIGEMVDFAQHRKSSKSESELFHFYGSDAFPSIPLNSSAEDDLVDVRERGRLKFSSESLEFFTEVGQEGFAVSNRLKGVVLHDILSRIITADDLHDSVHASVMAGDLTEKEAQEVESMLALKLAEVQDRGWYLGGEILNEVSLINSDGNIYRPDRVVLKDGKVVIIDYKFGEPDNRYAGQLRRYADIWRRMGYEKIETYLWYVISGDIVEVDLINKLS